MTRRAKAVKRSLILAGGGMKVAFQAGVLQVWLDEAGLEFDHADGASGGLFNLAMYCQGRSGTEIADAWRRTNPWHGAEVKPTQLLRGDGLLSLDRYRDELFPTWGLDFEAIRSSTKDATFNVCNFSRYELRTFPAAELTEDLLVAGVSLPMWFPPVEIDGETYVDSVYLTDANIEAAIERGADELWVIWTVGQEGTWRPGFVNQYFQIIEIAANGNYRRITRRIEANNAAIAAGHRGEFGRPIELKVLQAEVPVHYLLDAGADRLHEAVNRGVEAARDWCTAAGIPLHTKPTHTKPTRKTTAAHKEPNTLRFSEVMKGFITVGQSDQAKGYEQGRAHDTGLAVHLTINVDDVDRFVTSADHEATVTGHIVCPALGGELTVENGTFNLFVDEGDPASKQMRYRLHFRDGEGEKYTIVGQKRIKDEPGVDIWVDTTTLYTQVLRGHVTPRGDARAQVTAAGVISIHLLDFFAELGTFRTGGPVPGRPAALGRFGALFLGKLWDVYARQLLPVGPV